LIAPRDGSRYKVAGALRLKWRDMRPMSVTSGTKRKEGGIAETIRVVIHALIIALVIRTFLFQPFNIPSGSMKATLLVGDYLFVSKYTYGYSHFSLPLSPDLFSGRIPGDWLPQRGDVVVFKLPRDSSTDYIKRVIGLPGDKIQVIDGEVHINGVAVKREPAPQFIETEEGARAAPVKRWKETLPNGVSYYTLDLVDNGFLDNTGVYVVPPGHYFMMGDNRDNSTDSRVPPDRQGVGYVPLENIVGKAQIIFFSVYEGERAWEFWRWPVSVRWSRLFTIVR
jgi:signal peptidase I